MPLSSTPPLTEVFWRGRIRTPATAATFSIAIAPRTLDWHRPSLRTEGDDLLAANGYGRRPRMLHFACTVKGKLAVIV